MVPALKKAGLMRPKIDVIQYAIPRKVWRNLGLKFLLIGWLSVIVSDYAAYDDWWANGVWCVLSGLLLIFVLKKSFAGGMSVLLHDHLVMLSIAFLAYFVVGASLLSFGPEAQINYSVGYYRIGAGEAMRVNGANAIGFGVTLIVASLSRARWMGRAAAGLSIAAAKIPVYPAILLFLAFGVWATLNTLVVDLGVSEGIVDGVWRTVAKFSYIAIFLGASYTGKGEHWLRVAVIALTACLSALGLLLFNKTEMLLPIGTLFFGLSIRYSSRKIFLGGVFVILMIFLLVGNVVTYSRNTFTNGGDGSIEPRVSVILDGFQSSIRETVEGEYHAWARFCYTPPLAAGMDFYDSGRGGDDFKLLPWLFVPRFVAPDKPIISQSGADFHTKVTGQTGSSTGLGIFVSGYYNAGWLGLVVASAMCGWILAQTSRVAVEILSRRSLVLMPFAFLGAYMAFRIDGHFVVDYLGVFIFLLYPLLLVSGFVGGRR